MLSPAPPNATTSVVPNHIDRIDLSAQIQSLLRTWTEQKLAGDNPLEQLYGELLALVEPPVLKAVVDNQAGQLGSPARILGLHRTTLKKKIDQHEAS